MNQKPAYNHAARLRQYISKASFASESDRYAALECVEALDQSARIAELVAVMARLCELNASGRPIAKVWSAAQALVDSHSTTKEK